MCIWSIKGKEVELVEEMENYNVNILGALEIKIKGQGRINKIRKMNLKWISATKMRKYTIDVRGKDEKSKFREHEAAGGHNVASGKKRICKIKTWDISVEVGNK